MTKPLWNIPDQTRVATPSDVEPSATDATRYIEDDVRWARSRSNNVVVAPPMNYWGGEYQGLRIHTHPLAWRAIPIPIQLKQYRNKITVHVSYMTVDSSLRGTNLRTSPGQWDTNPGGEVEVRAALTLPRRPDWKTPIPYPDTVTLTNTNGVVSLSVDLAGRASYSTLGGEPLMVYLWVRSKLGAEVSPLVLGGNYRLVSHQGRRSHLEAPLEWEEDPFLAAPEAAMFGRVFSVFEYVYATDASGLPLARQMADWSETYFVEYEGWEVNKIAGGGSDDDRQYKRFTYPTFPALPIEAALGSGWFRDGDGNRIGVVEIWKISETTGLVVKSIMVEQDEADND